MCHMGVSEQMCRLSFLCNRCTLELFSPDLLSFERQNAKIFCKTVFMRRHFMVYLDNSATTQVDREVAELAMRMMTESYGNPSSLHHFGMDAYQSIMNARYQIARMLGCPTNCVCFTSGGTESNNLAIRGSVMANRHAGNHIITTSIEHSSVLGCCEALEQEGFSVTYVAPDPVTHRIMASDILNAVREDTILISMMHVNNETGEILPVPEIASEVKRRDPKILIHTDAVQSFGKVPVKVHELKADLISASGHKLHAPKGIGMLYIKEGCQVKPFAYGGAQERRIHPGTESVPLSCAFGLAAEKMLISMQKNLEKTEKLWRYLREELIRQFPSASVNSPEDGIPYILNVSLPGHISGDVVDALSMKDIFISAGSACSKGARSHVLESAGYSAEITDSALRISFSERSTQEEVDILLNALQKC